MTKSTPSEALKKAASAASVAMQAESEVVGLLISELSNIARGLKAEMPLAQTDGRYWDIRPVADMTLFLELKTRDGNPMRQPNSHFANINLSYQGNRAFIVFAGQPPIGLGNMISRHFMNGFDESNYERVRREIKSTLQVAMTNMYCESRPFANADEARAAMRLQAA